MELIQDNGPKHLRLQKYFAEKFSETTDIEIKSQH